MWDLPGSGHVSCISRQILNHWTTREIPKELFQKEKKANHKPFSPSIGHPIMTFGKTVRSLPRENGVLSGRALF